jgi:drug/metabolite transporter (DMT)-like permease
MKSRAEALPAAQGTEILRAISRLICDSAWLSGLILETASYILYFDTLAQAPVSLLAVMMQGGIAVFVVIAVVVLHERVNWAEAAGITGIFLAIVLLVLSLRGAPSQPQLNGLSLAVLSALILPGTAILCSADRLRRKGTAPAIASCVGFGREDFSTAC